MVISENPINLAYAGGQSATSHGPTHVQITTGNSAISLLKVSLKHVTCIPKSSFEFASNKSQENENFICCSIILIEL